MDTRMDTSDGWRKWLDRAPAGTTIPVEVVREIVSALAEGAPERPEVTTTASSPASWREKLWICPDRVRLGVREVAEALDRSPDWVYRAVNAKKAKGKGREPLPCRRLDGELIFEADAVRRWLDRSEEIVNPDRKLRAS